MMTETLSLQDSTFLGPERCRRCGSEDLRQLGSAHSALAWLVCNECWHVWGIPEVAANRPASIRTARTRSLLNNLRSGGRMCRARVAAVIAHVLSRAGMVACLVLACAAMLQAQATQAPAQPVPTHGRVFASDAGLVLNFVKPDKTADFEAIMGKLREALQKSDKPERKQQAASWKVMRAVEPGANGSVLYVFVIDPAVKGADYTVSTILAEAFPEDVQALYKQYADAYASGQNFVNLTLVSTLDQ